MVYGLVLIVHVLVAFFLIAVILLQGGRGGLGEALGGAAAQSLFGGGANTVMTRITAISAGMFIVTCLSLAALSTVQGRSVVDQLPMTLPEALPPASTKPSVNAIPAQPAPAPSSSEQPASPAAPSANQTPSNDSKPAQ